MHTLVFTTKDQILTKITAKPIFGKVSGAGISVSVLVIAIKT